MFNLYGATHTHTRFFLEQYKEEVNFIKRCNCAEANCTRISLDVLLKQSNDPEAAWSIYGKKKQMHTMMQHAMCMCVCVCWYNKGKVENHEVCLFYFVPLGNKWSLQMRCHWWCCALCVCVWFLRFSRHKCYINK